MNPLISGAGGGWGSTWSRALRAGYHVRALIPPAGEGRTLWLVDHENCELFRADLRDTKPLDPSLGRFDPVIDRAEAKTGDPCVRGCGRLRT